MSVIGNFTCIFFRKENVHSRSGEDCFAALMGCGLWSIDTLMLTPLGVFGDVWKCCGFNGGKFSTGVGGE